MQRQMVWLAGFACALGIACNNRPAARPKAERLGIMKMPTGYVLAGPSGNGKRIYFKVKEAIECDNTDCKPVTLGAPTQQRDDREFRPTCDCDDPDCSEVCHPRPGGGGGSPFGGAVRDKIRNWFNSTESQPSPSSPSPVAPPQP